MVCPRLHQPGRVDLHLDAADPRRADPCGAAVVDDPVSDRAEYDTSYREGYEDGRDDSAPSWPLALVLCALIAAGTVLGVTGIKAYAEHQRCEVALSRGLDGFTAAQSALDAAVDSRQLASPQGADLVLTSAQQRLDAALVAYNQARSECDAEPTS